MPRPRALAPPAVQAEWLRRVEEEYRSASIAQQLGVWLTQIGASPDLIRASLRIAGDELTHSEMSHRAFLMAGGTGGPSLARETLGLRPPRGALEDDVTRVAVSVFCLGETVAVPLFKRMREGCAVAVARRALDRILVDEVRHRDFGWALLDALLDLPQAESLRALIVAELPVFFARARRGYGAGRELASSIPEETRVWGLIAPAEYKEVMERTLTRDWIPRFGQRSLDAAAAWEASNASLA